MTGKSNNLTLGQINKSMHDACSGGAVTPYDLMMQIEEPLQKQRTKILDKYSVFINKSEN